MRRAFSFLLVVFIVLNVACYQPARVQASGTTVVWVDWAAANAQAAEMQMASAGASMLGAAGIRLAGAGTFAAQQVIYAVMTGYACSQGYRNAEEWFATLDPAVTGDNSKLHSIFWDAGNFVMKSSVVGQAKAFINYAKQALLGKSDLQVGQDGENLVSAENPIYTAFGPSAAYAPYDGQNFSVGTYFKPNVLLSAVDFATVYNSLSNPSTFQFSTQATSMWTADRVEAELDVQRVGMYVAKYGVGMVTSNYGPYTANLFLQTISGSRLCMFRIVNHASSTIASTSLQDFYIYATYDGVYITYGWPADMDNTVGPIAMEYFTAGQTRAGDVTVAYTGENLYPDELADDEYLTILQYFERVEADLDGVKVTLQTILDSIGDVNLWPVAGEEITLNDLLAQLETLNVDTGESLQAAIDALGRPFTIGETSYSLRELIELVDGYPVSVTMPDGTSVVYDLDDLIRTLTEQAVPDPVEVEILLDSQSEGDIPGVTVRYIREGEVVRTIEGGKIDPDTVPTPAPTPDTNPTTAPTAAPTAAPSGDSASWLPSWLQAIINAITSLPQSIASAIGALFVPDATLLTEITTTFRSKFNWIDSVKDYYSQFEDTILTGEQGVPVIYVYLQNAIGDVIYGTERVPILDMTWYVPYKSDVDAILSGILYVFYFWSLLKRAPEIVQGGAMIEDYHADIVEDKRVFSRGVWIRRRGMRKGGGSE